jgi:hypothetical protein
MYGNPAWKLWAGRNRSKNNRKRGSKRNMSALKMDKWVRSKAMVMSSSALTKKLQDISTDHFYIVP